MIIKQTTGPLGIAKIPRGLVVFIYDLGDTNFMTWETQANSCTSLMPLSVSSFLLGPIQILL